MRLFLFLLVARLHVLALERKSTTHSGLLGLAYSVLASNAQVLNYTSVAFSLFVDGTVAPIFSMALFRPTQLNPTAGGLLAIGGIPDLGHEGDFVSVPILPIVSTTYAFYAIEVDGFTILPSSSSAASRIKSRQTIATTDFTSSAVEAIIDSGSTLIYLPDLIADYIATSFSPPGVYQAMSGIYTVQCGAQAPRVGIIIGGRTFWIDGRDLISNETEGGGTTNVGICAMAVQRAGGGDVVLGDTFLRNVVAVFDLGENEMRFSARIY